MAGELQINGGLTINKTNYAAGPTAAAALDSADAHGVNNTQALVAATIAALDFGSITMPPGAVMVSLVSPATGVTVELSMADSTNFDAYRFAKLTKANHAATWSPATSGAIYAKATGGAAVIRVTAG